LFSKLPEMNKKIKEIEQKVETILSSD